MRYIVPEVVSLLQHLTLLKINQELYRYERCPHCGLLGMWRHGHYDRKSVRQSRSEGSEQITNPIPIYRFFCPGCKKTCSTLPECIAPRRWYSWSVQQAVLLLSLAGNSLSKIAKKHSLSRCTVRRWMARCKERFRQHKDALCNHFPELGRTAGFADFWQSCCGKMALSRAMYFCNVSGVDIP